MDETPRTAKTECPLLELPYELRLRILSFSLMQHGAIELQRPLWADDGIFAQPLFQVCHSLRDEALEAFYRTNSFIWLVDIENIRKSDPTQYPLIEGTSRSSLVTPSLPWSYPHLFRYLRYLNLNIYLPSDVKPWNWSITFPDYLAKLMATLDYGQKLSELDVLFTAKRFNSRIPLTGEQRKTLDLLSKMQVRGKVQLTMRFDFKTVKASIESLHLASKMRE